MTESFLGGRVFLEAGDCRDVLAEMPSNMFHACVTDPPYHLTSMTKRFGKEGCKPCGAGADGSFRRLSKGFMGKSWDGGDVAFQPELWAEVLRVLRPGGHLLAMGGTRTFHRLVCAIEDAGFEIRDTISWLYGSGFPKSHDVSRGIDRALGFEREKVRHGHPRNARVPGGGRDGAPGGTRPWLDRAMVSGFHDLDSDTPVSPEADRWHGWGTALKPAMELICLARKPLSEGSIAANVLKWGCGALNIDGCRIEGQINSGWSKSGSKDSENVAMSGRNYARDPKPDSALGRWPANVIHDGSDEVVAAFPESKDGVAVQRNGGGQKIGGGNGIYSGSGGLTRPDQGYGSSGSAARFFASFNGRDGEASAERRYTEEGATNFAALPGARRDGVEASRLFYTSKADASERINRIIEEVTIEWTSASGKRRARLQVDTEASLGKDIDASVLEGECGWNTFLCGSTITDLFRKATACTIATTTNSTIGLRTWNWLMRLLTSACTADVNYETANGGSHVASADVGTRHLIITFNHTVSLPGANHAASGTQLTISVSGRQHGHPTVKPLDLIQYLCRLICPPGGTVLDPFAGTGTTGEAAWREGFEALLIEREVSYCDDIRRRMALALAGPDERARESVKARGRVLSPGPLFDGLLESAE
jgi:DNA modification methylase